MSLPVTSGLVLHLDANAITGLIDGDKVSQWNDLSGNDNHATQSTEANKPIYKTNILNGKPVLRYSGTESLYIPDDASLHISPKITIFAVVDLTERTTGTTTIRTIISNELTYNYRNFWLVHWDNLWFFRANPQGLTSILEVKSDEYSSLSPTLLTLRADGSTIRLFVDGEIQTASQSYSTLATQESLTGIGRQSDNQRSWHGDLAEILVYDTSLSDSDREQVEQYLGEKWLGWEPEIEYCEYVADIKRQIIKTESYSADTIREIVVIAEDVYLADTVRQVIAAQEYSADTLRRSAWEQTFNADTKRRIAKEYFYPANTERKILRGYVYLADTKRPILKEQFYNADTLREVIVIVQDIFHADTVRQIVAEQSFSGDTKRRIAQDYSFTADTLRRTTKGYDYTADTFRKALKGYIYPADMKRRIIRADAYDADLLRRIVKEYEYSADTMRFVVELGVYIGDTYRVIQAEQVYSADTLRKIVKEYEFIADTLRKIAHPYVRLKVTLSIQEREVGLGIQERFPKLSIQEREVKLGVE